MAYPVGPRFSLVVRAHAAWNRPGLLSDTQVAVEDQHRNGWVLEVPSSSFRERLRLLNEETTVYLAQVLRESEEILFTFESPEDRALFLLLTDLDSIGPKTAGQILAGLGRAGLQQIAKSTGALPKMTGVGPKTLEKLRTGLKLSEEKFLPLLAGVVPSVSLPRGTISVSAAAVSPLPPGVLEALERLGLRPQDAMRLYEELREEDASLETRPVGELLTKMLQLWGRLKARSAGVVRDPG